MALGDSNEIWIRHRDWGGTNLDEFRPMNLQFGLRNNDADDIQYDISLAEPTMQWGFIGPKRCTYELWIGSTMVTAGIISSVNTKRGEEVVHCFGKGWIWYLQNRHYPFNGLDASEFLGGTAAYDGGLAYQAKKDPSLIIQDILDITLARPNSLALTYSLPSVGLATPNGFRIELADTTSIYEMIQTLSETEPGSFDFGITPQKQFWIKAPHLYPKGAETDKSKCIWEFSHFVHPEDLIDSEFENNGPLGTHIMGLAAGTASRLVRSYGYDYEQSIFGRWDMTVDFPDTLNVEQLVSLTQHHFSAGLYPQHNMHISTKIASLPNFWQTFKPGFAIWLRQDYEAQNIDGGYRINTINGNADTQGEITVDFELEQINKMGRPGTEQG